MKYLKLFEKFLSDKKEDTVTKTLQIVLDKAGIEYDQIIYFDKGSYGVVYDLGNGKLLKITNHKEEADTAAWIMKNDILNIAKIYDMFTVDSDNISFPDVNIRFPYWNKSYFIIVEKLDTSIKNDIEDLLVIIINNFGISPHKNTLLSVLKNSSIAKFIYTKYPQYKILYDDIYYLLKSLKDRYLINYYDAHSRNFGVNPFGNLLIFDVFLKGKKGDIRKIEI